MQIPPMAFDQRSAWRESYGGEPADTVVVEAASWDGRPVFFNVAVRPKGEVIRDNSGIGQIAATFIFIAILIGAVIVTRHNFQSGRVDRRGAARVAAAVFTVSMMKWVFTGGHVGTLWELYLLIMALSWAAFLSILLWLVYLAIEPFVRRHWPDALISWTRLHTCRFRDPLVASHILWDYLLV